MDIAYCTHNGCVVVLGNAVVDQVHDDATCRDKGSSRATVDVAKVPDLYGFVSVFAIEIAHGKQAFVQVEIGVGGTPTWICLPHD